MSKITTFLWASTSVLLILIVIVALFSPKVVTNQVQINHLSSIFKIRCIIDRSVMSEGSGFSTVHYNGVLTAAHVVDGCDFLIVSRINNVGHTEVFKMRNVYQNNFMDQAVIVPTNKYANVTGTLELVDKFKSKQFDEVSILYLDFISYEVYRYTGTVLKGGVYKNYFVSTFYIQPGFSGSPALNKNNEVMGIISQMKLYSSPGALSVLVDKSILKHLPDYKQ